MNESPHESLLIIAEQQSDGTFRETASGSLHDSGCAYFDHADLDGDGADEIVLRCDQLEGAGGYDLVRRTPAGWESFPQ